MNIAGCDIVADLVVITFYQIEIDIRVFTRTSARSKTFDIWMVSVIAQFTAWIHDFFKSIVKLMPHWTKGAHCHVICPAPTAARTGDYRIPTEHISHLAIRFLTHMSHPSQRKGSLFLVTIGNGANAIHAVYRRWSINLCKLSQLS